MFVIPAVDVKDRKCVRLERGDPSRKIFELEDPVKVALGWQERGAKFIHIVDLDGAIYGKNQVGVIRKILENLKIPSFVGGGIRSLEIAENYLEFQNTKVVLTSLVFDDRKEFEKIVEKYPERVVVALDFDEELFVRVKGWKGKAEKLDRMMWLDSTPIWGYIFTSVSRDGTGAGADFERLKVVREKFRKPSVASGGISSEKELYILKELGFWGAIVGRAFYEGKVNIFEL